MRNGAPAGAEDVAEHAVRKRPVGRMSRSDQACGHCCIGIPPNETLFIGSKERIAFFRTGEKPGALEAHLHPCGSLSVQRHFSRYSLCRAWGRAERRGASVSGRAGSSLCDSATRIAWTRWTQMSHRDGLCGGLRFQRLCREFGCQRCRWCCGSANPELRSKDFYGSW